MADINRLIEAIRNSRKDSSRAYTEGSCFKLYLILKEVFPNAEPWYNGIVGHVLTEIDGTLYDINGVVEREEHFYPLKSEPRIYKEAFGWIYE